jgi:hypothetical protein
MRPVLRPARTAPQVPRERGAEGNGNPVGSHYLDAPDLSQRLKEKGYQVSHHSSATNLRAAVSASFASSHPGTPPSPRPSSPVGNAVGLVNGATNSGNGSNGAVKKLTKDRRERNGSDAYMLLPGDQLGINGDSSRSVNGPLQAIREGEAISRPSSRANVGRWKEESPDTVEG